MGKLCQYWSMVHGVIFPCVIPRPGLIIHFRNTESPFPDCEGALHADGTFRTNKGHNSQVGGANPEILRPPQPHPDPNGQHQLIQDNRSHQSKMEDDYLICGTGIGIRYIHILKKYWLSQLAADHAQLA